MYDILKVGYLKLKLKKFILKCVLFDLSQQIKLYSVFSSLIASFVPSLGLTNSSYKISTQLYK